MSDQDPVLTDNVKDDLLWKHLKSVPAFRALLRAVEARFYQHIELPEPMLDLGCGDGHFAQMTFERPVQVGIDPWWGPLNKAERSGTYSLPTQALGDRMPFPDHTFASAFSNSVLEHIPDIQPVLDEVSRILQPGAPLVITVPSHLFTEFLGGAAFFNRLGLENIAEGYRQQFNRISRHAHTDPPELWAERLAKAGFSIERWQYYFSKKALQTLELGHVQGIPSAILHALTGHWILGPWESNLKWTDNWVRPYYEEPFPDEGAYLIFLARKVADEPILATLPAQKPFTSEELTFPEVQNSNENGTRSDLIAISEDIPPQDSESRPAALTRSSIEPEKGSFRPVVSGILAIIALLLAFLSQSALRASPADPSDGLRWLGLSFLIFIVLIWYLSPQKSLQLPAVTRPKLSTIPRRRWLYLLGLFLAFMASRFASGADSSPAIAILIWLTAITVSLAALANPQESSPENGPYHRFKISRFSLVVTILLFFAALAVRLYDLGQHPFILNGTEASLGLDALRIIAGNQVNPFGTGWLTNPNLPIILLSIPINLFGPSTLSLRILSPFFGAATVVATFLIGSRLYGRPTGLAAAILLMGSHFHIHFSRLGLTNSWDALIVLLSLGLIAIAWQQDPKKNRKTWSLAGLAVGFSVYLYTSSHLLPLMLILLFILILIFDRSLLRKQWPNLVAALAIAIIVSLPQLLTYQADPGLFMERANVLGILENQSGWLVRESQQTGLNQLTLLSQQFWRSILAFNATIDTGTSYGPFVPLLNFLAGILFLFGLILAIMRIRLLRFSMLLVWVFTTMIFAGTLLLNPPNSHRFIVAAPAVSLLSAYALTYFAALFATAFTKEDPSATNLEASKRNTHRALVIISIFAMLIALYDIGFYFGPYRENHQFGDRNTEIADSMAGYLNTLEGDWAAYFYGPPNMYVGFPTIPFLVKNFSEGTNLFDVLEGDGVQTPASYQKLAFIFLPERYSELEAVKTEHPDGEEFIFSGYYADPLFYVYEFNEN